MAWSRIESKFWQHPKFSGWKPSEKWALGELIGYCCEYRTEGVIPPDIALLPRSSTPKLLQKAEDSGWIDVEDDGTRRIHDWHVYHPKDPTASERVLRNRRKQERKQTVNKTVTETPPTNTSTNTKEPSFLPSPLEDTPEAFPQVVLRKEGTENGKGQTLDLANVLKEVDAA